MATTHPFRINRRHFLKTAGVLTVGFPAATITSGCKARQDQVVTFGVVTDSHYADRPPSGTRYYRGVKEKMRESIDFFNGRELDFIVHLGDLKDEAAENPNEAETLGFLRTIEGELARFTGDRYHVMGNHDVDTISKAQFLAEVENTGVDESKSYYAFTRGGYQFIVLDANFRADGTPYDHGNFTWDDCYIPEAEQNWLMNTLEDTSLPCLIFAHQLLDDTDDEAFTVSNSQEIRSILENSGKVVGVFQGHRHEELHTEINGIHYYTFNGMVDEPGLENNSFALVTLAANGAITIDGYYRARDFRMARVADRS